MRRSRRAGGARELQAPLGGARGTSAEIVVDEAGAQELVAEDAVNRQTALRDRVRHGGKRRGQLDGPHRVVVQNLDARRAPPLDELELAALRDAELDRQLAADAAARCLVRIDPILLDALADLVEVVLILGIGCVERNRLAFDAASPTLQSAATAAAEHAGGGRRLGRD